MAQISASYSKIIDAPPDMLYGIMADYSNKHPKILPDQYFSSFTVEHGGEGAGTIIKYQTHVLGQSRKYHAERSEPEPGHVITETDLNTGLVTTFTVESISTGQKTSVTIETVYNKPGIMGFLERLAAPILMKRIYTRELQKLAELVRSEIDPHMENEK